VASLTPSQIEPICNQEAPTGLVEPAPIFPSPWIATATSRTIFSPQPLRKRRAMAYVDSILEPGETVRYHTTVSWTIYTPAILLAICALAALLAAVSYADMVNIGWFAAIVFGLAAIVAAIPAWFRRWTTEIAVTDRRIILKRGLVRRHTVEMNMQKVESVDVDQTLIGRLFNYGTVTIRGTGSSFETLRMIDAPLKLRSTVTAG
jgi:membrane protein YdbS with pleckstrin-like domain